MPLTPALALVGAPPAPEGCGTLPPLDCLVELQLVIASNTSAPRLSLNLDITGAR
jgi:hypothetical protein